MTVLSVLLAIVVALTGCSSKKGANPEGWAAAEGALGCRLTNKIFPSFPDKSMVMQLLNDDGAVDYRGDVYAEFWSGEPLNFDPKSTFYLVYFSDDDKPYGVIEQYGNGDLGSWATVRKVCPGY